MGVISLNGQTYVVGPIDMTWVPRQSPAYRTQGTQSRGNDPSMNHFLHRSFPWGIGWSRIKREIGRGVGGLLDSTCWTALGPVTLGKLQEVQSHAANADHWKKAVNFKSDLWGLFERDFSAANVTDIVSRKFGATSDDWTGGGQIRAANDGGDPNATGIRGFDLGVHKGSLFVLCSGAPLPAGATAEEFVYGVASSAAGATWADAGLIGWPDSATTNRYLTSTITRRNDFNDDMGRLLSFGNVLLAAIYRHPSSTDGTGLIEVLSSTDSGANWASDVTIPASDGPKAFVDWVTIGGVRSPVLVIPDGVYSIDYTNNTFALIYALDGDPNTGRWAEVGNDGSLYVGLGSGSILRLTIREADNLDVMVIGPPGDGLVTAKQGRANYILKTPSEWLLVAYGGHAASRNASIFMIDTSVILTDPETGKRFMPWHHMYQDGTANLDIVALAYSTEDDATPRLHFAVEGAAASVNSHIEEPFVNPKQSTTVKYQATSILRLPDDDLGDPQATTTILDSIVDADDLSVDTTGQYITLRYGLNGASDTTTTLGNFLSGIESLAFGASSQGVADSRIGINLLFTRDATNTNRPLLNEFGLEAYGFRPSLRRWSMRVDIKATAEGDSKPNKVANENLNETVIENLVAVAVSSTLVLFQDSEATPTTVRVRVPPDAPPVFHLEVIGSTDATRGYRTGTCDLVLEQAL